MRPRLEREVENHPRDMMLVIVDVDDCPDIKGQYHTSGVPTVIAFMNGQEVDRFVGENDRAFVRQFLDDLPALN